MKYDFFFKKMKSNKNNELIDLNYHSQYYPQLGIRFNVECIHHPKIAAFFGTLASIVPKAEYYNKSRGDKNPTDIFLNTTPHFDSFSESFQFYEGDEIITGFKPDPEEGMTLFVDIFSFDPA